MVICRWMPLIGARAMRIPCKRIRTWMMFLCADAFAPDAVDQITPTCIINML